MPNTYTYPPPAPDELQMLTTEEVAELVRRSPQTVRNWIKKGDLPAVMIEGAWLIPRRALATYLDQQPRPASKPVKPTTVGVVRRVWGWFAGRLVL